MNTHFERWLSTLALIARPMGCALTARLTGLNVEGLIGNPRRYLDLGRVLQGAAHLRWLDVDTVGCCATVGCVGGCPPTPISTSSTSPPSPHPICLRRLQRPSSTAHRPSCPSTTPHAHPEATRMRSLSSPRHTPTSNESHTNSVPNVQASKSQALLWMGLVLLGAPRPVVKPLKGASEPVPEKGFGSCLACLPRSLHSRPPTSRPPCADNLPEVIGTQTRKELKLPQPSHHTPHTCATRVLTSNPAVRRPDQHSRTLSHSGETKRRRTLMWGSS